MVCSRIRVPNLILIVSRWWSKLPQIAKSVFPVRLFLVLSCLSLFFFWLRDYFDYSGHYTLGPFLALCQFAMHRQILILHPQLFPPVWLALLRWGSAHYNSRLSQPRENPQLPRYRPHAKCCPKRTITLPCYSPKIEHGHQVVMVTTGDWCRKKSRASIGSASCFKVTKGNLLFCLGRMALYSHGPFRSQSRKHFSRK